MPLTIKTCTRHRVTRHESPAHPHDHDHDHVNEGHGHRLETEVLITKTKNQVDGIPISQVTINKSNVVEKEDDEDMEEMFILGPAGMEWGGPTRGGRRPEPTRYGDWERKGRVTDF